MKATYKPSKPDMKLNVRQEPNPSSKVVGEIHANETVNVVMVDRGWCRLSNGFADARFLIIEEGEAPEVDEVVEEQIEEPEDTEEEQTEETDDDETVEEEGEAPEVDESALKSMTNPQLYELAINSGIKVKKGASKPDMIAAILADLND